MLTIKRLSLLFFTGIACTTMAQKIDLENELVAFYPLDGNAQNMVADENHGIESNVSYVADRMGAAGKCCLLYGNNSFITIPHTEVLNWDARIESYSILFWFKSDDPLNGGTTGRRILSKWNEYPQIEGYPFSFPHDNNIIRAANREKSQAPVLIICNDVFDNRWHMIAMLWDHTKKILSVYLDNKLVDSLYHQFYSTTSNTSDILIGKMPVLDLYYKGFIDDIFFYNRIIDPCEIDALYTGQLLQER